MANNKSKPKKPMGKGKKIALISISAALLVGGGVTAYMFSGQIGEFIDKWFHGAKIAKVDSEYQVERGVVENEEKPETVTPYVYLGSATEKVVQDERETVPTELVGKEISAHTFLIGRVNSVPFYQSGWTKFDYENIGMTISFSNITSESISTSLSTTNERTESTSWEHSTHFQNTFKASVSGGFGPIKANAENTIDYQVDNRSSGSSMQRYVSSNEQTKASVETLQKTADYTIELNSRNGFKKGKYYRMTLQQTASMYMVIYEYQDENGTFVEPADDIEPGYKFYQLTSFLADPSNYTMVVEETDDPSAQPAKSPEFDPNLYNQCATWIEEQREHQQKKEDHDLKFIYKTEGEPDPEPRLDQLKELFKDNEVKSDYYHRDAEWRIKDIGRAKNPSDKVTFPTLFKSKLAPTFGELFNKETDEPPYTGLGFKTVDVEIQFEFRRFDRADQHVYLVDKNTSTINEVKTDIDSYTSWTKKNITWTGIDAIDKLRTSMVPSEADGWIHVMYNASGTSSDDWGIRNFVMQVTIRR